MEKEKREDELKEMGYTYEDVAEGISDAEADFALNENANDERCEGCGCTGEVECCWNGRQHRYVYLCESCQ